MDVADPNPGAGSGAGDVSPTASSNAKARKRTKTGCLTCRKRRIKCGEERPTCANCIKSKRQCEGYNQRVVFKPPIGDWPNHPGVVTNLQYHNSMLPGSRAQTYRPTASSAQASESTLSSLQPRPLSHFDYRSETPPALDHLNTQHAYTGTGPSYGQDGSYSQPLASPQHQPLHSPQHQLPTPTSATSYFPQTSPVHASFQSQYAQNAARYSPTQYQTQPSHDQNYTYGSHSQAPIQPPQISSASYSQAYSLAASHGDDSHSIYQPVQIPQHDVSSSVAYMPQHAVYGMSQSATATTARDLPVSGLGRDDHISLTQVLEEAAVEEVDDDYWDVDSDAEMADMPGAPDEDAMILSRDFSLMRKIQYQHTNELSLRRYDAFIYEGVLASYKAEQVANPLKNPRTARVFAHFIHVTAPSLSIYERNPRNPASLFEGPTPPSQQNLWTYILPLKALNHQGLLHAMLALASLHIAILQRASVTPSYKHYAYALKRLGRSLANPKRRHTIATVATSLLLAFYEVMTAEHVKWSTHLVGAAQLLSELDFPSLTREARRLRAAQEAQESKFLAGLGGADPLPTIDTMMPDEGMVSAIIGKKVSYEDFGRVLEPGEDGQEKRSPLPGKLDIKTFETLQDLQWFYMRHDAFQSMVSGNPLITPFRKWSNCPPRAPLGRPDAVFGTHDHVVLLIARIADFAVRDRPRKLKQVEANGGQWRPSPNMPGGMPTGPPSAAAGPSGSSNTPATPMSPPPQLHGTPGSMSTPVAEQGSGPQQGHRPRAPPPMPAFYGMAPTQGPSALPRSYATPEGFAYEQSPTTSNTPHPKFADLPAALAAAEEEWQEMSRAHATIASTLTNNEAFSPLSDDLYPVAPGGNMTPFGPALVHRSYDISTIWTMLHLSKILLIRSHPAMPPAATIAAGVAAATTKPYAMLIGRVSAGMQVPASDDIPLSPFLGAALIETTMALFFAGVQYQEPPQRAWLIKRLLSIDRRTGWASAAVIARACETSWERAAEAGRGPRYEGRKTRPYGEDGPIVLDGEGDEGGWGGGGVVRGRVFTVISDDARYTAMGSVRVPWAKNVLASEEELRADMERVELKGR
ncbi:C6 finger domain-containing protein [Paraphaeosphaeria sporulosa]